MRLSRFGALGLARLAVWLAACPAVCIAVWPAAAGNWTLGGQLSERLEARSDLGFNEDDEAVFRSSTRLGMALGYVTPTTAWQLRSGASYRHSFGAEEDGSGLDGIANPRLSGSVVHRGLRQSVSGRASVARRVLNFNDAPLFLDDDFVGPDDDPTNPDPGIPFDLVEVEEEEATETVIGLGAGWNYSIDPLTSLSLGTDARIRRFSEESSGLVPSRSITFSGGLSRSLDPRTSAGLSLSYRNFQSDGQQQDVHTDALTLLANASRQLTSRHSLGVSLGGGVTQTEETNPFFPAADNEGLSPNFQGGVTFSYIGMRGTSFVLSASRSLQTTSDGRLVNANRLSAAANYGLPLTRLTSFRLGGIMSLSTDSDDEDGQIGQGVRLRAGLNTRLSRAWDASTGVDLGYARDEDDDQLSAGVFLQVGRSFTLNR